MKSKKFLQIGLAIILALCLCACGGKGDAGIIGGSDGPTSILVSDGAQTGTTQDATDQTGGVTEDSQVSGEQGEASVSDDTLSVKTYIPAEGLVKVLGRADFVDDTLWMVHSGSGAEFTFVGTKATIAMQCDSTIMGSKDSQARIAIFVNGECVVDDMIDKMGEVFTVFESETQEECTIKVVKLSEAAQSTVGIASIEVECVGDIQPTAEKEHLIEFIGDSITCGYGVEDEDRNHHFSTKTENNMKTYAYKTAEALDADYSMVSFSGYGIISGYSGDGQKHSDQTVAPYYEKLGFSYGAYIGKYAADVAWDFAKRQPDVIVINLGTNDESYTKTDAAKREEYVAGYVDFLKLVRKNNPDATIFCTLGIMGDALYASVEKAAQQYSTETGDTNIHTMKFAVQSASDGYAADWHPTEATHTKAAEKLTKEIQTVMGW